MPDFNQKDRMKRFDGILSSFLALLIVVFMLNAVFGNLTFLRYRSPSASIPKQVETETAQEFGFKLAQPGCIVFGPELIFNAFYHMGLYALLTFRNGPFWENKYQETLKQRKIAWEFKNTSSTERADILAKMLASYQVYHHQYPENIPLLLADAQQKKYLRDLKWPDLKNTAWYSESRQKALPNTLVYALLKDQSGQSFGYQIKTYDKAGRAGRVVSNLGEMTVVASPKAEKFIVFDKQGFLSWSSLAGPRQFTPVNRDTRLPLSHTGTLAAFLSRSEAADPQQQKTPEQYAVLDLMTGKTRFQNSHPFAWEDVSELSPDGELGMVHSPGSSKFTIRDLRSWSSILDVSDLYPMAGNSRDRPFEFANDLKTVLLLNHPRRYLLCGPNVLVKNLKNAGQDLTIPVDCIGLAARQKVLAVETWYLPKPGETIRRHLNGRHTVAPRTLKYPINIYELETGHLRCTLDSENDVPIVQFELFQNERCLLSVHTSHSKNQLKAWDLQSGKLLWQHSLKAPLKRIFAGKGETSILIAYNSLNPFELERFDLLNGKPMPL